jgi:hypothetical protein
MGANNPQTLVKVRYKPIHRATYFHLLRLFFIPHVVLVGVEGTHVKIFFDRKYGTKYHSTYEPICDNYRRKKTIKSYEQVESLHEEQEFRLHGTKTHYNYVMDLFLHHKMVIEGLNRRKYCVVNVATHSHPIKKIAYLCMISGIFGINGMA